MLRGNPTLMGISKQTGVRRTGERAHQPRRHRRRVPGCDVVVDSRCARREHHQAARGYRRHDVPRRAGWQDLLHVGHAAISGEKMSATAEPGDLDLREQIF
jgi:hypothetical protein